MSEVLAEAEGDPLLIVGWRVGRRIEAARVQLHPDTFEELRKVAETALAQLDGLRARTYEASSELEAGEECYKLDITALAQVAKPHPGKDAGVKAHVLIGDLEIAITEAPTEEPAFLSLLGRIDGLESISAERLHNGRFLFYAIGFGTGAERTLFLKKKDPTVVFRRGLSTFIYGEVLKKVEKPDFVLEEDVDIVISSASVYAFSKSAFEAVMSDVRLALQDVPKTAKEVATAFTGRVEWASGVHSAIEAECSRRLSYAIRLRNLSDRVALADLTADRIRKSMMSHGEDPSTLLNSANEFDFGEDAVGSFLDVCEGRWFEDDFTGEKRRADRLSRR